MIVGETHARKCKDHMPSAITIAQDYQAASAV